MIYSIYISHKISLQKWPPFQEHQLKSWRQMAQVQGAAPVQAGTKPWGKSLVTRPSEPWEILGIHGYPTFFLKAFHCDMEELMTLMGLMGLMMKLAQSFFLIVLKHLLCDDFTGLSLRHAPSFMAPIWIETGDISGYPPVCITLEDRSPRYCNV